GFCWRLLEIGLSSLIQQKVGTHGRGMPRLPFNRKDSNDSRLSTPQSVSAIHRRSHYPSPLSILVRGLIIDSSRRTFSQPGRRRSMWILRTARVTIFVRTCFLSGGGTAGSLSLGVNRLLSRFMLSRQMEEGPSFRLAPIKESSSDD